MMKVSDPIIFGHCVKSYYSDVFAKHGALFDELKVTANNGIGDVYDKIKGHPKEAEIKADILKQYETRLDLLWLTPTTESPISMSPAMSSLMPPCQMLSVMEDRCGTRMTNLRKLSVLSLTDLMLVSTMPSSRIVRRRDSLTGHPLVTSATSVSWLRKLRSMAATTRPLRLLLREQSLLLMMLETRSLSMQLRLVTSGECVRPRICPSRIGSNLLCQEQRPLEPRLFSGLTPTELMMPT